MILSGNRIGYISLALLFGFALFTTAQDPENARTIIKILSSPEFNGRGYTNSGDRKAAEYIAAKYEKIGLKKFGESYFQEFNLNVNSFPGNIKLEINGLVKTVGVDFIVDPSSPSLFGSFEAYFLSDDVLNNELEWSSNMDNAKGKFVVLNEEGDNPNINQIISRLKNDPDIDISGVLVISRKKLSFGVSQIESARPLIYLKSDFPANQIGLVVVSIESKFLENYVSRNVVGYIPGKNGDSVLVVTAHYDHLGQLGHDAVFSGANDNASGVALLLELAEYFSSTKINLKYDLVFIAFGGEEAGLVGSANFVRNPPFRLQKIKFLLNFDIVGTGDKGITVVNGSVHERQFNYLTEINVKGKYLPEVRIRGKACNSDHCLFDRDGVPAFYIYTLGGGKAYHDIHDIPQSLTLHGYQGLFYLSAEFIKYLGEEI